MEIISKKRYHKKNPSSPGHRTNAMRSRRSPHTIESPAPTGASSPTRRRPQETSR
jgi:hypothetical protein